MKYKDYIKPIIYLGIFILVILLRNTLFPKEYVFNGSVFDPRVEAHKFSLQNHEGEEFDLALIRNKVSVLFFGYTHCPDICPTTLTDFKRMIVELEDDSELVDFVMITVDPDRDTPERVSTYATSFHPDIIGLSGSTDELKPIWDNYFVIQNIPVVEEDENYLVEHTTRIFVVDKSGALRLTFPLGMPLEAMLADINYLINE